MFNKIGSILKRKEKLEICLLIFASMLLSLSEVISITVVIPIITLFMKPELINESHMLQSLYRISKTKSINDFLILLSLVAIVLFVAKSIYSLVILYWQQKLVGKIHIRLTTTLLDYYLEKDYSFHLNNNSASLFKNISAEIGQFTGYVLMPVIQITSEALVLLGLSIMMFSLYPLPTLTIVILVGLEILLINLLMKKKLRKFAEERTVFSELFYRVALESLSAVKEIQVYDARAYFVKNFQNAVDHYTKAYVGATASASIPGTVLQLTLFSSVILIVLGCVYLKKSPAEVVPMLSVMVMVALRLIPSITRISAGINSFHYSFNALNIIHSLINQKVTDDTALISQQAVKFEYLPEVIKVENIRFSYSAESKALFENLTLDVPMGKITAFIGETGSGKSTLIDIIMGLLSPSEGIVNYGEVSLSKENVIQIRKRIGYVPQATILLDDTIAANVAFGIPECDVDYNRVKEALKIAQLKSFIESLPDGIYTAIGEKGVRLSGGQRQRIGIARALYRDPLIIVLDEATSALDIHTEKDFYEVIKSLNKTVLMVTHRISTLEMADMIFIIDKGKIMDKGTLKELIDRSFFLKGITKSEEGSDNEESHVQRLQ